MADNNDLPECPKGRDNCPIFDELRQLKKTVENLNEEVRTDALTGLFNKRHLLKALATEMERSRRSGQAVSLIMFDADHFKQVNDQHGHAAGDQVLVNIAQILQSQTRVLDICCRYGGEEFAIVLPATHLLTATQVAERIRCAIASTPVSIAEDRFIHVTASLGVGSYTAANRGYTVERFIERADAQLYRAKAEGRNRVRAERSDSGLATSVSEEEKAALFKPDDNA